MPSPSFLSGDDRSALDRGVRRAGGDRDGADLSREGSGEVGRGAAGGSETPPRRSRARSKAPDGAAPTRRHAPRRARRSRRCTSCFRRPNGQNEQSTGTVAAVLGAALVDIPEHPRGYVCYRAPSVLEH